MRVTLYTKLHRRYDALVRCVLLRCGPWTPADGSIIGSVVPACDAGVLQIEAGEAVRCIGEGLVLYGGRPVDTVSVRILNKIGAERDQVEYRIGLHVTAAVDGHVWTDRVHNRIDFRQNLVAGAGCHTARSGCSISRGLCSTRQNGARCGGVGRNDCAGRCLCIGRCRRNRRILI